MSNKMVYDFETALKSLLNAQSDVTELVTKWGEMLASDPRDVVFHLKGPNGEPTVMAIPNIQKVISTLTTRALPQNPEFETVRTKGHDGQGRLENGGLNFEGVGAGATYSALGVEGTVQEISANTTIQSWPPPRYMYIKENASPAIIIRPRITVPGVKHMADFFVWLPANTAVDLSFSSPGGAQVIHLVSHAEETWHVVVMAEYEARIGVRTKGRITRMGT